MPQQANLEATQESPGTDNLEQSLDPQLDEAAQEESEYE